MKARLHDIIATIEAQSSISHKLCKKKLSRTTMEYIVQFSFISLPVTMVVPRMAKKLNMAPYPYKNKFCDAKKSVKQEGKMIPLRSTTQIFVQS